MTTTSRTQNMVSFSTKSAVWTASGPITVTTKTHDGMNKSNDLFNKMIVAFLRGGGQIFTAEQVPKGPNHLFRTMTGDLIKRIHTRKHGMTPILPGGARGATVKVHRGHIPNLKHLLGWLALAAPQKGSRQWMLEQPTAESLFTQEGVAFVKEVVDGLIE